MKMKKNNLIFLGAIIVVAILILSFVVPMLITTSTGYEKAEVLSFGIRDKGGSVNDDTWSGPETKTVIVSILNIGTHPDNNPLSAHGTLYARVLQRNMVGSIPTNSGWVQAEPYMLPSKAFGIAMCDITPKNEPYTSLGSNFQGIIQVGHKYAGQNYVVDDSAYFTIKWVEPQTDVTCWKCLDTGIATSQKFPSGTTCGSGSAVAWPYSSKPTCPQPTTITCWRCLDLAAQSKQFTGIDLLCGAGIASDYPYTAKPDCSEEEHLCWGCFEDEAQSLLVPKSVSCGSGIAKDFPYSAKPDCDEETFSVSLIFTDRDYEPLSGVKVIIGEQQATTGEDGTVNFELYEGIYEFSASLDGYQTIELDFPVSEDFAEYMVMEKVSIPGFELLTLLVALGMAFILLKKRKK